MDVLADRPGTPMGTMVCVWAVIFARAGTFEIVALVDMMDHHRPAMAVVLDDTDDFGQAMALLREALEPNTALYSADVVAHDTCVQLEPADKRAPGKDALGAFVPDNGSLAVMGLVSARVDPLRPPHEALEFKKNQVIKIIKSRKPQRTYFFLLDFLESRVVAGALGTLWH